MLFEILGDYPLLDIEGSGKIVPFITGYLLSEFHVIFLSVFDW